MVVKLGDDALLGWRIRIVSERVLFVLESGEERLASICEWNTNETYHPIMPHSHFMLAARL